MIPASVAFKEWPSGLSLSWGKWWEKSLSLAAELGITAGERIGLPAAQNLDFFIQLLAIWQRGGIPVLLNAALKRREFLEISEQVGGMKLFASAGKIIPELPEEIKIGHGAALILLTSGTEGKPKAVEFSHAALGCSAEIALDNFPLNGDTVIANLRPSHTSGGTNTWWPAWRQGLPHILVEQPYHLPRWHSLERLVEEENPSLLVVSPAYLKEVSFSNIEQKQLVPRRGLSVFFGGERLNLKTWEGLKGMIKADFHMRYGFTECAHVISQLKMGEGSARGADDVGLLFKGVGAKRAKSGKLEFCSPGMAEVQWREGARLALLEEGWILSADEGELEEPGPRILLAGRDSGFLSVNGQRFHKSEIESVLLAIPGVSDIAIFPESDRLNGERYSMAVIGLDGLEEDIASALKEGLSDFKRPYRWRLVGEAPLTRSGKKNLRALHAMVAGPMNAYFSQLSQLRTRLAWRGAGGIRSMVRQYLSVRSAEPMISPEQPLPPVKGKYSLHERFWLHNALAYYAYKKKNDCALSYKHLEAALGDFQAMRPAHYGNAEKAVASLWILILLNHVRLANRSGDKPLAQKRIKALLELLHGEKYSLQSFPEAVQRLIGEGKDRFSVPRDPGILEFYENLVTKEAAFSA